MDIFDFTQALWRQRKMLILGFIALLAGVFFLVFEVGEDGIQQRITPKYVAQVRMAVVSAELESFSDITSVSNFSGIAELYAELLRAPEASVEIQEDQDVVFVEPMEVAVPTRTSFVSVNVTSDSPENAKRAALGAFEWLEDRLVQPPNLADLPTDGLDPSQILDSEGRFLGQIRLSIDRQFVDDDMFLVITNSLGDDTAVPLNEVVGISVLQAYLVPSSPLEVSIEDTEGVRIDATTLDVPALPEEPLTEVPSLSLALDAGAIRAESMPPPDEELETTDDDNANAAAEVTGAALNPARISAHWDTTPVLEQAPPLTLLLITEDPVPVLTGTRRTPIIALAGLGVGLLLLLVGAVTVDTWQQAYAERGRRRRTSEDDELEEIGQMHDDGDNSDEEDAPQSDGIVAHLMHQDGAADNSRKGVDDQPESLSG